MTENKLPQGPRKINNTFIRRIGLACTGLGLMVFVLGAKPDWFGLDISETIGFVQIGVFSFGLLLLCLGGTLTLSSLWPPHWRSIPADIGLRLAWSGLVLAVISGMADVIGLGTRPLSTSFTFFGHWQARGVLIGQIIMFIGFVMMIPMQTEYPPRPHEKVEESGAENGESTASEKETSKIVLDIEEN
jgi:hypothetical protein